MKVSTGGLAAEEVDGLRRIPPIRQLPGRNPTKADILVYRHRGLDIALKHYGCRPLVIRNTIGRYLLRRESAAYRAAGWMPGLPRFYGRVGPFTLAMEWIDARPLAEAERSEVALECFDRLESLVHRLHERGIALADLHHRDVLIDEDRRVHIVDLAAAWVVGDDAGRMRRSVFRRLCEQDRIAVARMRARFAGTDEAAAIEAVGAAAASRYRRGRRIKRRLDRLRWRR